MNVFAYGTLQIPEVMQAVTGALFPSQPAWLEGYARYRLSGLSYPGLRAKEGSMTDGVLYRGVGREALAKLDAFEDTFYHRASLRVTTVSGDWMPAEVYIIPPEHGKLIDFRPWSFEEFRRDALAAFLKRL